MSDSIALPTDCNELLDSIKQTIAAGRLRAARAVTNLIIETHWAIGHEIVVRRRGQSWSPKVADQLAAEFRVAHPGMRGLSGSNLHYMATISLRHVRPGGS